MTNITKKSSYCSGGDCVEVEFTKDGFVLLKDSDGDYVSYSVSEWREFIKGVKNNEFDV